MACGIRGDANHGWAQNFSVKDVARLQFFEDGVVRILVGVDPFDGVMEIGIEGLAEGFDFLQAVLGERVEHLLANQLKAFAIFVVRRIAVRRNGAVESVEYRKQALDNDFGAAMALLMAFAVGAFAIIVEVGLQADKSIFQVGFFSGKFFELIADDFFDGRAFDDGRIHGAAVRWRGVLFAAVLLLLLLLGIFGATLFGIAFRMAMTAHDNFSPFNSSEKNWDISATTVMTRS
jgi:hypothetical protein